MEARIFALADVFDALSSERPYKEPYPLAQALSMIEEAAGSHFDPQLVQLFCQHAEQWQQQLAQMSGQQLEQMFQQLLTRYLLR